MKKKGFYSTECFLVVLIKIEKLCLTSPSRGLIFRRKKKKNKKLQAFEEIGVENKPRFAKKFEL